jgi:hypothetical protein
MLADGKCDFEGLLNGTDYENGVFARHLRRIRKSILEFPELAAGVVEVLQGKPVHSRLVFNRLHTIGVLGGEWRTDQHFQCELYHRYLKRLFDTGELVPER